MAKLSEHPKTIMPFYEVKKLPDPYNSMLKPLHSMTVNETTYRYTREHLSTIENFRRLYPDVKLLVNEPDSRYYWGPKPVDDDFLANGLYVPSWYRDTDHCVCTDCNVWGIGKIDLLILTAYHNHVHHRRALQGLFINDTPCLGREQNCFFLAIDEPREVEGEMQVSTIPPDRCFGCVQEWERDTRFVWTDTIIINYNWRHAKTELKYYKMTKRLGPHAGEYLADIF